MSLFQPNEDALRPRPDPSRTLVLEAGEDVEHRAEDLRSAEAVVVKFPSFRDGRGFSTARLLRGRLGFDGPVYADGPLIPDQAGWLWRSGFDGVFLGPSPREADWRAASRRWNVYPQPDPGAARPRN